jgi:hypothetical protein
MLIPTRSAFHRQGLLAEPVPPPRRGHLDLSGRDARRAFARIVLTRAPQGSSSPILASARLDPPVFQGGARARRDACQLLQHDRLADTVRKLPVLFLQRATRDGSRAGRSRRDRGAASHEHTRDFPRSRLVTEHPRHRHARTILGKIAAFVSIQAPLCPPSRDGKTNIRESRMLSSEDRHRVIRHRRGTGSWQPEAVASR